MEQFVECGRIVNTHGVRGEVKAEAYCDNEIFSQGRELLIGGKPYRLLSHRRHGAFLLLTLEGIVTVEQAMPLKGKTITIPRASIRLKKGQYLYQDLYGFAVLDLRTGQVIGRLAEVLELPASMLYRVEGPAGEILIPAVPPFHVGVDFEARQLQVRTIEGMLPHEN